MILLLPNTYRAFYGAFQQLHPIQQQAIEPILAQKDLIIQSATGSGKTEAVLAPCMERVIRSGSNESILYIVPTRALAADIYRRFKSIITERLGLGFAIRTGDVKHTGGGSPTLMLTTPESLDVMLGSSNQDLRGFLTRVRTVIIDEAHSFIHQYRGRQLVYLLQRLERRIGSGVQRIALSATLADPEEVGRFLGCSPDTVFLADKVSREIVPRLVHLENDEQELIGLLDDLYREWDYHKVLIFANSRGRCDKIFGLLNQLGSFRGMAHLHYSNLTAQQRQRVECSFRKQSRSICIATSTLELGIDVGDVDAVLLFEPPDSVAAFLQRIGRANRRQNAIHFWGVCRGERAGQQMLRFLALLSLARQGRVEAALPKMLPSVLSQQIISCLYEKKRLSLAAVQDLFIDPDVDPENDPDNEEATTWLENIFQSLVDKQWLRKDSLKGLYTGGWRYWDALVEHRIWANFPETEIEYKLDVAGEAVADIPQTIVKQLDPGDKVLLAGRPLRILWISTGPDKRVLAEPTQERLDDKELLWLGMGCHVSLETAQAMRAVLKSTNSADNEAAAGLFSRSRNLIRQQMAQDAKAVLLDNGIEVVLADQGSFQYRTYLGAVGNMLMAWSVKEYFAAQSEDIEVMSDEIGLVCSQWLRFEKLCLPLQRSDFIAWIKRHFKVMRVMFPLNAFCTTLPLEILRHELTDFILDQRLIDFFQQYKDGSSEIVAGDPRNLEFHPEEAEEQGPAFLDLPSCHHHSQSLLSLEKERHGGDRAVASVAPLFLPSKDARYRNRPLTGTIIGEYFRHHQCHRQFCASFLRPEDQPPRQSPMDDEYASLRLARGVAFEQEIMAELAGLKEQFHLVREKDQSGMPRSLESRFAETRDWLQRISSQKDLTGNYYLAQGVFVLPALLSPLRVDGTDVDGVGIPDLIRVSSGDAAGEQDIILEVGDIKSVVRPRYHQKWQVAFYAFLLKSFLDQEKEQFGTNKTVQVADTGFLLIRSPLDDTPQRHTFDLRPYLATLPALLRNFAHCLSHPPDQAEWQLQPHCLSCPCFASCYQQALHEEDIQFIPRLSKGALEKMRGLGLRNIGEASAWFADNSVGARHAVPLRTGQAQEPAPTTCTINTDFSPMQRERLQCAVTALEQNKIALTGQTTDLFPAHITTCFFIHLQHDPVTMLPKAVGLGMGKRGEEMRVFTWVAADTSAKRRRGEPLCSPLPTGQAQGPAPTVWRDFSTCFLDLWQETVENNGTPHIFFFGSGIRQGIDDWAAMMEDGPMRNLFRYSLAPSWTDLAQVLHRHFALPIPATLTLYDVACVLGLSRGTACRVPTLPIPESLVHFDPLPDTVGANPCVRPCLPGISPGRHRDLPLPEDYLAAVLNIDRQLQQWITSHLSSDWSREEGEEDDALDDPAQTGLSRGQAHQRFIEAERAFQEKDIRDLQELSLAERVERFRALGPLNFTGTGLDDEGRFLYLFEMVDGAESGVSKFRQGDFLKLVPLGVKDLQSGMPVIVDSYEPHQGSVALASRQRGTLQLQKNLPYSLEEDADDWTTPKLIKVVQTVYSDKVHHPLVDLFAGAWDFTQPLQWQEWISGWLRTEGKVAGLNAAQQKGLQMPFRHALSLIQGPPGTGKTNLLGWILIALIRHAQARDEPLRIAVSALTHQAIDQVLSKVVKLVNQYALPDFPGRCCKWGRRDGPEFAENSDKMQVEPLEDPDQVMLSPYLILGATGYGLAHLQKNKKLPTKPFDWVIFDEASQILLPQAMLSLVHGKGNFLFLGDVHQLPPVIRSAPIKEDTINQFDHVEHQGNHENDENDEALESEVRRSLLTVMLHRYPQQSVFLDLTYRMNAEICAFPSRIWYDSRLHPAPANATARLSLKGRLSNAPLDRIIDPEKPVVLVRADHHGCGQESIIEAEIMARLAHRLLSKYGLQKEQLALISPHRAQNNRITRRLTELLGGSDDLPLVDTVERIQGAEREVILFGFTCSDPDQVLGDFLNNPNRFNVAITRARHKLIVVGSETFFAAVAQNEENLRANVCFKEFFEGHPAFDGADVF
ncbi:MAG: DEAD/DEAH box helicase [Candidatus Electrothrix communis]|nr:MAG: DEAD/DEAH box helicase [Candidatus Electrothrix communis]